jgi:hypothetical protein
MENSAMHKRLSSTMLVALIMGGAMVCVPGARIACGQQTSGLKAQAPHDEGKNTIGEMSAEVARVRLQKLGYSSIKLARQGDYWQATAVKNGQAWQVSLHARTGARQEKQIAH